jgi:hypothetical protein
MHALETEQGWRDYGKANRNCPNKTEAFTTGWTNLHRYHPEYDHRDRERFLAVFSEAAKWIR